MHDLGVTLVARGHDVQPAYQPPVAPNRDGRGWDPRDPDPPASAGAWSAFLRRPHRERAGIVWHLVRGGFDLAHAFFPADAWAAFRARRLGGPPYIFSIHGIVNRKHLVRRRYRIEMFVRACAGAEATSVLSEAAAKPFRQYLYASPRSSRGCPGAAYADPTERDDVPTFLCPASLDRTLESGESCCSRPSPRHGRNCLRPGSSWLAGLTPLRSPASPARRPMQTAPVRCRRESSMRRSSMQRSSLASTGARG